MILNGENGQRFVPQSGHGAVVEVYVRDLNIGWQAVDINGEAVIVGCDLDFTGREVFDRLVSAAVAEF